MSFRCETCGGGAWKTKKNPVDMQLPKKAVVWTSGLTNPTWQNNEGFLKNIYFTSLSVGCN